MIPLKKRVEIIVRRIFCLVKSSEGQTLVEYGLLVVLIAVIVLLMLKGTGREVNVLYSKINSTLGQQP